MRAARDYWATVALAALALQAAQWAFYHGLDRLRATAAVDPRLDRRWVAVDEYLTDVLDVSLDAPAPLDVEAALPGAATDPGRRGGPSGTSGPTGPPGHVRGVHPVRRRRRDGSRHGLLTETLRLGPARTLTVEPRGPRDVHVGEAGEPVAAAFGDHLVGRLGAGLTPMELREYVHGDAASRIDWKATARMNHPYVRKEEAETDRMTTLLLDARAAMDIGLPGETKLDDLREVALAVAAGAREHVDPLGLYVVGEAGPVVTGALGLLAGSGATPIIRWGPST